MIDVRDIETSAAMACARGIAQANAINQMLNGGMLVEFIAVPYSYSGFARTYGRTGMDTQGWINLRKRLIAAGFIVSRTEVSSAMKSWNITIRHRSAR